MPEDSRFNDLRADIKESLNELKVAIADLRQELRTDYVGRREFDVEIGAIHKAMDDEKASSRWTASQIILILGSLAGSAFSVVSTFVR